MGRPFAGLLCLAAGYIASVRGTCLQNAIPPEQRKNLTRAPGESYPLGVWINNWAAGYVTSAVARILIEEKMGYNVVENGPGPGTLNAFYALAGCTSPMNLTDRGCGTDVTYSHVNMEAWGETYALEWDQIQREFPSMAPVDVGSMGYEGKTSLYFPQSSRRAAYLRDGTVLDYFRGWNSSWSHPWLFFDDIASIDKSLVYPCNQTRFFLTKPSEDYLRVTGDAAGVTLVGDELVAVCPDDYWWLAPSCRANASQCVPYLTGGIGWQLDEVMQKATAFDMPLALGVARSWSTLPLQVTSIFYWWVPDPTFLDLEPIEILFPPYDFNAWKNEGDKRTSISNSPITKTVSQDLATLAPNVEDLIRNVRMHIDDVNAMMRDRQLSGDTPTDAACRWLQTWPSKWEAWLPDKSKCFPGFGLYDTSLGTFVNRRENLTYLECRACESGTYSAQLQDDSGLTFRCAPCAPGTSQASGAALSCEECQLGEYQGLPGKQTCQRCGIGTYQDQRGSTACEECIGGTTLGFGSVSLADCGCEEGWIDLSAGAGNLSCAECGEGLDCPPLSTLSGLVAGTSDLGEQFVPRVMENFYSTADRPLSLYRCLEPFHCPGGVPGSCSGGLENVACTDCPAGQNWSTRSCEDCSPFQIFGWIFALVIIAIGLIATYYLLTSQATAKASVLFTTTCACGMTISMLQSVGIVGMMTVDFPAGLKGIFEFMQIFVLDIDSFAFSCVAGNSPAARYVSSALFFPAAVLYLLFISVLSKLFPEKYRWEATKRNSTIGQVMQVGFSTMSTIAMAPLTCFSHPNSVHSILKYPAVDCGSQDHTIMAIVGGLLLAIGVLGFLSICTYAAVMVPKWSNSDKRARVRSFRFLVFRFRLDSWWFGVPLLTRGPLLSLPIALATDYPPVQVMFVILVLLLFLAVEVKAWPWKVPLLNVLSCFMAICITMLVSSTTLHLEKIEGPMLTFADTLSTVIMSMLGLAMLVLVTMTTSALCFKAALGGQKELYMFNLQQVPSSEKIAAGLKATADQLATMPVEDVSKAIQAMSIHDLNLLRASLSLLVMEITPDVPAQFHVNLRIQASSFQPTMPTVPKKKPSPEPALTPRSCQSIASERGEELLAEQEDNQESPEKNDKAAPAQIENTPEELTQKKIQLRLAEPVRKVYV